MLNKWKYEFQNLLNPVESGESDAENVHESGLEEEKDTLPNETISMQEIIEAMRAMKMSSQLAFYVNLHRAVIGPSATLTGR